MAIHGLKVWYDFNPYRVTRYQYGQLNLRAFVRSNSYENHNETHESLVLLIYELDLTDLLRLNRPYW